MSKSFLITLLSAACLISAQACPPSLDGHQHAIWKALEVLPDNAEAVSCVANGVELCGWRVSDSPGLAVSRLLIDRLAEKQHKEAVAA